jgi:hypothetical protein
MLNVENEKRNYIYHMIRDVRELNGLQLKAEHKATLFCLESRGDKVFPSHETLSDDVGVGTTKLKKVLNELKDHEIIGWIQTPYSSNRYKLNRALIYDVWYQNYYDREQEKLSIWNEFHPDWDLAAVEIGMK